LSTRGERGKKNCEREKIEKERKGEEEERKKIGTYSTQTSRVVTNRTTNWA
jgi:hypothetical protein